jgi:RNA polymerase sigma factor (sigma-70 family)
MKRQGQGEAEPNAATSSGDEAMSRYAQGDDSMFPIIYDSVAPRLEPYLRRHLRDASMIEDVIQQTMTHIHEKRGTFNIGCKLLPWAFCIAKNFMIDTLRKTRRETATDMTDERTTMGAFLMSTVPPADQVLEAQQTKRTLLEAYDRLTPHQRTAYELTKGDGLSQLEAAEALQTTVMGVKQCIHKATAKLRAALLATDDEPAPPAVNPPATLGAS